MSQVLRRPHVCLTALVLLCAAPPAARGKPPPLPRDEQERVNLAIDRGVLFLKAAQGPRGTWATEKKHVIGYTALPALTLLECGQSRLDPSVTRALRLVRAAAPTLDTTYELSLAILFLDKHGDPLDRPLIQSMALRLIAGQTSSGGWSYKCPALTRRDEVQLFQVLKQLEPLPHFNPNRIVKDPRNGRPVLLDPGKAGVPGFLVPRDGGGPGFQVPSSGSPGEEEAPSGGAVATLPADRPAPDSAAARARLPRPGDCIKSESPPPKAEKGEKDDRPRPPARIVIPARLMGLPVLRDPRALVPIDPEKKGHLPIGGTTDNSNSQFAMLALWAARRHDVPMKRSLNLLVFRYRTSQNADGGWAYRYVFGGGGPKSTQAMTCVGLLGLAIGHGTARGREAGDDMLVKGFQALGKFVGTPSERIDNKPQPNLYFLWSLERVGVLYDLPKIGDKDWYRWGAQRLVAHQQPHGNWIAGGYPGDSPVIDTCLALLFLKRVNLAQDLTKKLDDTRKDLEKNLNPGFIAAPANKPPKSSDLAEGDPEGIVPLTVPPAGLLDRPKSPTEGTAATSAGGESAGAGESDGGGNKVLIWGLCLLALLLLAGSAALLLTHFKQRDASEGGIRKRRPPAGRGEDGPAARKPRPRRTPAR